MLEAQIAQGVQLLDLMLEHAVEDAIRPEGLRAGIVTGPNFSTQLRTVS